MSKTGSKYRQCLAGGQEEARLTPWWHHTGEKGALGRGREAGVVSQPDGRRCEYSVKLLTSQNHK